MTFTGRGEASGCRKNTGKRIGTEIGFPFLVAGSKRSSCEPRTAAESSAG